MTELPRTPDSPDSPVPESQLVASVRSELVVAGRLESAVGQMALAAAQRVAGSSDTGSSYAALLREARTVLAEAVKGAHDPTSALTSYKDELAARRLA